MRPPEMTIEPLTAAHVADAVALLEQARWPHRREEWALVLDVCEGFVALEAGRFLARRS